MLEGWITWTVLDWLYQAGPDFEANREASFVLQLFEKHFERNIGSGRFLDIAAEDHL